LIVARTITETRDAIREARRRGYTIGFVPTMGALHAGHAALIDAARSQCEFVVVSIFVNPLQFGPNEDFNRYPRALPADLQLCESHGASLVFAPAVSEMYPVEQFTFAEVGKLGDNLCGAFRPGHFRGMATVVLKLFNIVQPDIAFFGEKDLQQLAIIRRMVRDLALPIAVAGVETAREPDGLAMSSRNAYLSPEQRQAAAVVRHALLLARDLVRSGERRAAAVQEAANRVIAAEAQARLQYFELVDDEMQPVSEAVQGVWAATAVWFGSTRLIDNICCS